LFGDYLSVAVIWVRELVRQVAPDDWVGFRERMMERLFRVRRHKDDVLLSPVTNWFLLSHFSPNVAPYPLFPLREENRFALMSGEVWVMSMLNISGLQRWLAKRGWDARVIHLPEGLGKRGDVPRDVPIMHVFPRSGDKGSTIGLVMASTAAAEFWMPEAFETTIRTILEHGQPGQEAYQVNFPHRGKWVWD